MLAASTMDRLGKKDSNLRVAGSEPAAVASEPFPNRADAGENVLCISILYRVSPRQQLKGQESNLLATFV